MLVDSLERIKIIQKLLLVDVKKSLHKHLVKIKLHVSKIIRF